MAKALEEAYNQAISHGQLCTSHLIVDQSHRIRIDHFRLDYDGAAAAFYKATSPDSGNPQSHENWLDYGETLIHLEEREAESREALEKARDLINLRSKMMPNDGWSMAIKARIYARLGDFSKARELAIQARNLSSKNPRHEPL